MKKKIIIAGGSGLIGSRLVELLNPEKYDIHILTRSEKKDSALVSYINWDTSNHILDPAKIEGADIVINFAGAGIADKRWTTARKKLIRDSRVDSAITLAKAMKEMDSKPECYIGASAVGFYGDRGNSILSEDSAVGQGFLPEVCLEWERAHESVFGYAKRNIIFRIGIVLSTKGGALAEILKTTWTGTYGYFGDGSAYYPWIHIDDLCRMFEAGFEDQSYSGVYNCSAKDPVTIKELVTAVKKAKGGIGPLVPVPGFALKLALGEMATMLLSSMRAVPTHAISEGFEFKFDRPVYAIEDLIQKGH